MISVCMATYNGVRWIEEQLQSVLSQLNEEDEIVLVDDGSSDHTLEKVRKFKDSRIRIFQNETNLGVCPTFEKALTLARGNVLFLCDQDDIWYPGKVKRVMEEFEKYPNVTVVLSDAQIIDSTGRVKTPSYYQKRGKYIRGVIPNIIKEKFLGCTMAVKSSMRDYFLPFPEQLPGHDVWIGLINEYYGRTHYIPDKLIGYRRHDKNVSPERRQSVKKMFKPRWKLIIFFSKRIWKLTFCKPL